MRSVQYAEYAIFRGGRLLLFANERVSPFSIYIESAGSFSMQKRECFAPSYNGGILLYAEERLSLSSM